jgi:Icc-related predicted phosphoesterase
VKLLFVTDLHGGNAVLRKTIRLWQLLEPDYLVIGGDVAGKYLAPIVTLNGGKWRASGRAGAVVLTTEREVANFAAKVGEEGGYAVHCSEEELARLKREEGYREQVLRNERSTRLREWLVELCDTVGDQRVLMNLGNDDPFYLDDVVEECMAAPALEYRDVELSGGIVLVSCGYTNKTPWQCPRDIDEEELEERLIRKFAGFEAGTPLVANLHCPPAHTSLDRAPRLDSAMRPVVGTSGFEYESVGSSAVRRIIERYQPTVALHGHVHEAYGRDLIGRTVCVSPGSAYHLGELRAAVVHVSGSELVGVQLVREP